MQGPRLKLFCILPVQTAEELHQAVINPMPWLSPKGLLLHATQRDAGYSRSSAGRDATVSPGSGPVCLHHHLETYMVSSPFGPNTYFPQSEPWNTRHATLLHLGAGAAGWMVREINEEAMSSFFSKDRFLFQRLPLLQKEEKEPTSQKSEKEARLKKSISFGVNSRERYFSGGWLRIVSAHRKKNVGSEVGRGLHAPWQTCPMGTIKCRQHPPGNQSWQTWKGPVLWPFGLGFGDHSSRTIGQDELLFW